jgi:hypothetical protein
MVFDERKSDRIGHAQEWKTLFHATFARAVAPRRARRFSYILYRPKSSSLNPSK